MQRLCDAGDRGVIEMLKMRRSHGMEMRSRKRATNLTDDTTAAGRVLLVAVAIVIVIALRWASFCGCLDRRFWRKRRRKKKKTRDSNDKKGARCQRMLI